MATKKQTKTFKQAVEIALKAHDTGKDPKTIAANIEDLGYPNSRGTGKWHAYTILSILRKHRKESPWLAEKPKRQKATKQAKTAEADVSPPLAHAETPDVRRGHKRMTRAGWESLPEPVREAVVERIYKDVVGL